MRSPLVQLCLFVVSVLLTRTHGLSCLQVCRLTWFPSVSWGLNLSAWKKQTG